MTPSDDGALPEPGRSSPQRVSQAPPQAPPDNLAVPRNRSMGNFVSQAAGSFPSAAELSARSGSFDAAYLDSSTRYTSKDTCMGYARNADFLARAALISDHDHSLGLSGLRKIRQSQPLPRSPSFGARSASSTTSSRPTSMILPPLTTVLSEPQGLVGSVPPTPGLGMVGEDLTRFSSESLHSFSFSSPTNDGLQNRQNTLKRSVEIIKDRKSWATGGLNITHAQAKASGDKDLQRTMSLLNKAHLFDSGTEETFHPGFFAGPMTGPVLMSHRNPFEENFAQRSESPTDMDDSDVSEPERARTPTQTSVGIMIESPKSALRLNTDAVSAENKNRRPSLKRTYTDTEPLYLQEKINDALAQPYISSENTTLSPTSLSSSYTFPQASPHVTHGRSNPATQAIFTTQAEEPWTITAANDMACLIFGVTKHELRKIGILDVVCEDKREWLASRLRRKRPSPSPTRSMTQNSGLTSMGNGITARLLSKPSSREAQKDKRSTEAGTNATESLPASAETGVAALSSRGVLLCGDVLPILKRNGASGSASLWVQEKRSSLIWVVEEIAEDIAMLDVDEVGCIVKATGKCEAVWGLERVRNGMDIARLLPTIPRIQGTNTGALDFADIARLRRFTARTANDISVPITVDQVPGESSFRVSSFPNIAGMLVISAETLTIKSSNTPIAEALFGLNPNGLATNTIIPGFDKMLSVIVGSGDVPIISGQLAEGIVIPEHSFRRARARLAHDEGRAEVAAVFLRPGGVPAKHRDGAEIMIDVQMRVVRSDTFDSSRGGSLGDSFPIPELVYALWVTYSRTVHAANHGVGPLSPLISRPGTPPHQPSPDKESDEDSDTTDEYSEVPDGIPKVHGVPKEPDLIADAPPTETRGPPAPPSRSASNTSLLKRRNSTSKQKKTIDDFKILEDMGAGAYGQVKLARNKKVPYESVVLKYVVKKRILVDTWTRDRRLGTVPLEIHVLDYLRRLGDEEGTRHPNIVEMSGFFEDDVNYYIEMVPHGIPGMDLFDYIELRVDMQEAECRRIFTQVASAVEFLHTRAKVVHRDIKDENIILDGEGVVKLIDFGSASYLRNGPFDVFVGTIDYAAPEVLQGASYKGMEQDIWALGILLYTIIYKENPFYSIDEIMDHDLRVPFVMSETSIDLVRRMLDRDVAARPTITEVVQHPWCRNTSDAKPTSAT